MPAVPSRIVIATRESALALWQAEHVKARLEALHPGLEVALLGMTTEGDRRLGSSLAKIGGKGLFVKELEDALLHGRAHIAVHSMKDVPVNLPPGFAIAAICAREDPRDAFVSVRHASLESLPAGAVVGTSSLRREAQIRARLPHLRIEPLRGNVQTRLRKLDEGLYDAIILASAGLKRLGLEARITALLPVESSIPAVGQGAVGIECCEGRDDLASILAPIADPETTWCVTAERAVSRRLSGSCTTPLAAYARIHGREAGLLALVASPDGTRVARASERTHWSSDGAQRLGDAAAASLERAGALDILASLAPEGEP